jgi:hypothetical protein
MYIHFDLGILHVDSRKASTQLSGKKQCYIFNVQIKCVSTSHVAHLGMVGNITAAPSWTMAMERDFHWHINQNMARGLGQKIFLLLNCLQP